MTSVVTLGWREWLALPQLGIVALKAKVDTGARSSSLHVESLQAFRRDGADWVRFVVRSGRRHPHFNTCEARVADRRAVTDSGGHVTRRWFIRTELALAGVRFEADINLTDRRDMLFPMLVGRSALNARFLVDPARSYLGWRPDFLTQAPP